MKRSILAAVAAAAIALPMAAWAQSDTPVGKVNFSGGAVAAGVGYSWGSGTLVFQGKTYEFTVNGFSVANVGAASVDATGNVYNLTKVEDFDGTYTAAGAGATIGGGGTVMAMENQHGVVMHVQSRTAGLHLNLSASGINISLKK